MQLCDLPHCSGFANDAAGNLTQDGTGYGTHTFQWDAEGRLKSVDSGATASFVYNALGQRVEKQVGSAYTETLYDAFGNVSGYHNRTAWVQDFIPLGSRIFAKYQDGVTYYLHGNPLGSTQVVMRADYDPTTNNGWAQAYNYFPWGGRRWSGGSTVDVRFAGMQERDLETTTWQDPLDPTPFRVYTSGLGRWLSPDPLAGDVTDPQSLNRYAYVLNNPTNFTDPSGLCFMSQATGGCVDPQDAYHGAQTLSYMNWLNAVRGWDFVNMVSFSTIVRYDRGDFLGIWGNDPPYAVYEAIPVYQNTVLSLQGGGDGCGGSSSIIDKQVLVNKRIGEVYASLATDPDCLAFLQSAGVKLPENFSATVDPNSVGGAVTQVFVSPEGGYGPESSTTTIAGTGGFFSTGWVGYGLGGIATGTPRGQALILVHEMGHATGVLLSDASSVPAQTANNEAVRKHCKKTLSGFSNH